MSSNQPVIIAKVGAPHGVRGDLRLHVFTEDPDTFFDFDMSQLMIEEKPSYFIPLKDCEIFEKGGSVFIKFKNFLDRDLARRFVNKTIAVAREALPVLAEDDVYWSDLEGLEVINQEQKILGHVDHILETGANDVLFIKGPAPDHKEHLVPYVDAHVLKVDLANKKIFVDWDEDF